MGNDSKPVSGIRIDSEGEWFYRNVKMTRQEIISLFYQHLRQSPSGSYFIEIGEQRCDVEVEDTAYVVWALRWAGEGTKERSAILFLSDGSSEALDAVTLRIGENHVPYCSVKNRRFEARFSRSAYYKLAEHLQHDPANDTYFVFLNGRKHEV